MTVTTDAPARATGPQKAANGDDARTVRTWLRDHGYEVGVRGTIAAPLLAAYNEAHPA